MFFSLSSIKVTFAFSSFCQRKSLLNILVSLQPKLQGIGQLEIEPNHTIIYASFQAPQLTTMAPLWQLCRDGKLDEVRRALARGEDVNSKNERNRTGLMLAVVHKRNSVVRLLLEQPTLDLNCIGQSGKTALHYAANGDNVEGVRMLLADPRLNTVNLKDKWGMTPVMVAMFWKKVNALRELVNHPSVDLDTRDASGSSLEEVARWV